MAGGGAGRVPAGATVLFTDRGASGSPPKAIESAPIRGETAKAATGARSPFPVGVNSSRSTT